MGKGFYFKLALNNVKRNNKKFIPYFIAATIMISVYFMVLMIIFTPGLANVPEGAVLQTLFSIGFVVLNIFVTIFMLYINNFLIKHRKKELGLYGILGLEKRHVGHVLLWENLIINGSAIVLGIITACIFGWLIFMLLLKSMQVTTNTYFALPWEAFAITFGFFMVLFLIICILNFIQIRLANPIDLLKSEHQGEKKVRFMTLTSITGLALLAYAYYTAWNVNNSLQALNQFFVAVVLVIFATNMLFTTGSIALLKVLKSNKKYYYKPDNFISVAGMFHRMKQNASGLASICILSSMVLVTVSTCVALFIGQEDSLVNRSKDDIVVEVAEDTTEEQFLKLEDMFDKTAKEYGVVIENTYRYLSYDGVLIFQNGRFIVPKIDINFFEQSLQDAVEVSFLSLKDYNRVCNKEETLEDNQLIILSNGDYKGVTEFTTGAESEFTSYQVKAHLSDTIFTNGKNRETIQEIFLVVKNREAMEQLVQGANGNNKDFKTSKIILNLKGTQEDCYYFGKQIHKQYGQIVTPYGINNIYSNRASGYSIFGGLLFMGAFFTVIFLSATVLIIYFKQISEGYEDKDQFEMLQKVGMDDREVKRTINKQILTVFFLPLIGALLHVFMASKMIIKMLEVFGLYNVELTVLCLISSGAIFTLAYIIVYRLTARTYCRIVKW